MIIASWAADLARRWVVRSRLRDGYLLGHARLGHAFLCERSRVDRNGSVLAVLRSLEPIRFLSPDRLERLSEQLQHRLRITDTAGINSDGYLNLLLPDTSREGAERVADDLRRLLVSSQGPIDFEIVVYPDGSGLGGPGEGDGSVGRKIPRQRGRSNWQNAETVFAWRCPAWKRGIDIIGASFGLVFVAPVILSAALAIRLTSPGGAFFRQLREGHGGRRFWIYKLRTMRSDAEALKAELRLYSEQDGPAFKMSDDPRVTPLGRILRKTSIDELPQLWNVLKGDMSLVGPRPLPVDESESCAPWQRQRLTVRPGITCIWQVRGRSIVTFDEWVRMDLKYVRRRSLWYDLFLLIITGPAVVLRKGPR
jgi:lipopolysaccharide/colanic/teichoic acid biosynthesis glycosyltransferase